MSKYTLEKFLGDRADVKILNADLLPAFQAFAGTTYLRNGIPTIDDPKDLQSFTLSRFAPPELMGYQGRAVVIDPDIFAVRDPWDLLTMDLQGKAIALCKKKDAWDSSMMVMDCAKLRHWSMDRFLGGLKNHSLDYRPIMTVSMEPPETILEVPRRFNSLDVLNEETILLHTTKRLTQPWRTGLPIDFKLLPMKKILGIIPREPILKLLGRLETTYQPHPDKNIEQFFFKQLAGAYDAGYITKADIDAAVASKDIRPDVWEKIAQARS